MSCSVDPGFAAAANSLMISIIYIPQIVYVRAAKSCLPFSSEHSIRWSINQRFSNDPIVNGMSSQSEFFCGSAMPSYVMPPGQLTQRALTCEFEKTLCGLHRKACMAAIKSDLEIQSRRSISFRLEKQQSLRLFVKVLLLGCHFFVNS